MFIKISFLLITLCSMMLAQGSIDLQKRCKEGNATACYTYALPLVSGENAKTQDIKEKGISYMRQGCSLMENRACDFLGENYFKDKRYRAAIPYLEQSCNRNVQSACIAMGTIYRDGHDVRIDDVKSREYYEKACTLKSGDACYAVALVYRAGFGVKKDRFQEKSFYKKACDNGLKAGCDRFTEMDDEDKGIKRTFWEKIKSLF